MDVRLAGIVVLGFAQRSNHMRNRSVAYLAIVGFPLFAFVCRQKVVMPTLLVSIWYFLSSVVLFFPLGDGSVFLQISRCLFLAKSRNFGCRFSGLLRRLVYLFGFFILIQYFPCTLWTVGCCLARAKVLFRSYVLMGLTLFVYLIV